MRMTLALILVVGLSVGIADADAPPLSPEKDARLAKVADAKATRIGILTYYPNQGGGYTFLEGKQIAFVALPQLPTTRQAERLRVVREKRNGIIVRRSAVVEKVNVFTIGTSKMAFGGQTIYRSEMMAPMGPVPFRLQTRVDIPIAKWSRDTPDGKFQLSIMAEDSETRMKLKSIVPVLEHASQP
jgi:hypothetical protein